MTKVVAGAPLIRPVWFFDTNEQGEALTDIGAHLVDLVQWTAFPGQAIHYQTDVHVLSAQHWPTMISEADFKRVTGGTTFPKSLQGSVRDGQLEYFCKILVSYTLREFTSRSTSPGIGNLPAGATPISPSIKAGCPASRRGRPRRTIIAPSCTSCRTHPPIRRACSPPCRRSSLPCRPNIRASPQKIWARKIRLTIPDALRVGHEAHFAQVTANFLSYMKNRATLPTWERPNMLAKYYVTTKGTELSREAPATPAARIAPP